MSTKCRVCGEILSGQGKCPVCGFTFLNPVGIMTDEMQAAINQAVAEYRSNLLKGVKVYVRAYYWEDKNGELTQTGHEDILIGQNLEQMSEEQVSWSSLVFAKQTPGEKADFTIIVEDGSGKREVETELIAPDTEDMWKAGMVLKSGLKVALRIGDKKNYADSALISVLRGSNR